MRRLAPLLTALLTIPALAQNVVISQAARDPLSYLAPVTPLTGQGQAARPAWQDEHDPVDPTNLGLGYTPVVQDGVNVYYLKRGQLIAADPLTGQRRWKYGAGLGPALSFNSGLLAVGGADGRVHLLETYSDTRTLRWVVQSGLKGVQHLYAGPITFASTGNQVVALGPEAKRRWSVQRGDSGQVVAVSGLAAIYQYTESGAITETRLAALNVMNGSLLWERGSVLATLLAVENGTFALWTSDLPPSDGPDYAVEFVNGRTGKTERTLSVHVPSAGGCGTPVVTSALLNPESLWLSVQDRCSQYPVRFLRAQPDAPIVYNNFPQENAWLAGPYEDKVFITTQIGDGEPACLQGLSLTTRDAVFYDTGCIPVASLTIAGGGLYVGLVDGQWRAFDLRTGQLLLRARLDARAFGPTLVLGGAAVVQAEGRLLGFALPPRLR